MSDQYGNFQGVPQTPAPTPYQQPPYGRLDKGYPCSCAEAASGYHRYAGSCGHTDLGCAANCGLLPCCVYRFS